MKFELADTSQVDWSELDRYPDRTFSQRKGWLDFVLESQGGRAIVARLHENGTTLGYFTGVMIRKFGVRVMGSPFPGWSTPFMGLNLRDGVPRVEAVRALVPFVFRELGCLHLELNDAHLEPGSIEQLGFETRLHPTFINDLSLDEEAILRGMADNRRWAIRKAIKNGVTIEEAEPEGFAVEYYTQLLEVFAKQDLRPTHGVDRVESLIEHVHPTGDLLLLRARSPEGLSVATGIYPGYNGASHFWGNGSLSAHQNLRPNEPLHWEALRRWKARGSLLHNWGGGGEYKGRYGGRRIDMAHFHLPRFAVIGMARQLARKAYYYPRALKRNLHLKRVGQEK